MVKVDNYMKPIIPNKYNIVIHLKNGNLQLLELLEPWCDRIYTEETFVVGRAQDYIEMEQSNTDYDLGTRVHTLLGNDKFDYDDILIEIDGNNFTQQDYQHIMQFSEILDSDDMLTPGSTYELGNLKLSVNQLKTYTDELIKIDTIYNS